MASSSVRPRGRTPQFMGLAFIMAISLLATGLSVLQPAVSGPAAPVEVYIAPKATAGQIAVQLEEKGLIRSALAFRLLAKLKGLDSSLQAGRYFLSPGRTPGQILEAITSGDTRDPVLRVTIPEGYTVRQIAAVLAAKGVTGETEFLEVAKAGELKSRFFGDPPAEGTIFRWEGFFFPDTYFFRPGTPAREVAQRMLTRMDEVWAEETRSYPQPPLNLNPRELVTLASLVEREAKVASERPLVARVFYNRLHAGMSLQSCATIQYLLPAPKPHLLEADTRIPSPYNTYLNPGLPPGPIASPGRDSLRAVLNPAEAKYLYFVAKPDGTHAFSTSYREHLNNQRRYQK